MNLTRQCLLAFRLSLGTLRRRLGSSLVIAVGMACVTAVLLSMLSMNQGLLRTLRADEDSHAAIVHAANSPYGGGQDLTPAIVATLLDAPGIATGADGKPLASAEFTFQVPPAEGFAQGTLHVRGIRETGVAVRRHFRMVSGRSFQAGRQEMIVGAGASRGYGLHEGDTVSMPDGEWPIVGTFVTGGTLLESELVADADTLMASARASGFGTVLVRLTSPEAFDSFKQWVTANPSLAATAERLSDYYIRQYSDTTAFFSTIAWLVGGVMAIGALFGSMKILYAVVNIRTREIATLRALGYDAFPVAASIVLEALSLSLAGALVGAGVAWLLFDDRQGMTGGTVYNLLVSPRLLALGIGSAAVLALLGGLAPAVRAARLPVAEALRAT